MKNSKEFSQLDYEIPDYSLHPVNLENKTGRGIAVYSHKSLEKSTIQIDTGSSFEVVKFFFLVVVIEVQPKPKHLIIIMTT